MSDDLPYVLVTGSTRGIGAAIVDGLQRRAHVMGHGSADADLSDPSGAERLWEAAIDRFGRIDVLINSAGVFEPIAVDADLDDWHAGWGRTMQINLQASADLCRRAILHWRERRVGGRIVNIA